MTENTLLLRCLYGLNIMGAGLPGALILFFPVWAKTNLFVTPQSAPILGILGSLWFAIGVCSVIGLVFPQTFKVIFILQLIYKSVWLVTVAIPLLIQRQTEDVLLYVYLFLAVIAVFSLGLFGHHLSSKNTYASVSYEQNA